MVPPLLPCILCAWEFVSFILRSHETVLVQNGTCSNGRELFFQNGKRRTCRLFLPISDTVDIFGHARVFPPPLCHGLLEGKSIDVFKPSTVCVEVVGDVFGGVAYCNM